MCTIVGSLQDKVRTKDGAYNTLASMEKDIIKKATVFLMPDSRDMRKP